ncbi:MAG: hypothetical protein JWM34_1592 [Ilumatobacteraceae bacterium]|nr:hypothetical protein [Ilumatobacteraceae bacterium]
MGSPADVSPMVLTPRAQRASEQILGELPEVVESIRCVSAAAVIDDRLHVLMSDGDAGTGTTEEVFSVVSYGKGLGVLTVSSVDGLSVRSVTLCRRAADDLAPILAAVLTHVGRPSRSGPV